MVNITVKKPKEWAGDREWWRQAQERDSRPCHNMKVIISPNKIEAAQRGTWILTCEVKNDPISQGAHVGILCPADWIGDHGCPGYPLVPICDASTPIGYGALVTVSSSNSKVQLEILVSNEDKFYTIIDIVVLKADLIPGDIIKIIIGDPKSCLLRAQRRAQKAFFEVAVDPKGDGKYLRVEECPIVEVIGGFLSNLTLTAQPAQLCKQQFKVKVATVDRYGNISEGYNGEVEFQSTDSKANLPEHSIFKPQHNGKRIFNISLNTPGIHTILALDKNLAVIGKSNPILVEEPLSKRKFNGYQIFFGDLHVHTMLSDGYGEPDEAYTWAKGTKNLDFCTISDHSKGGFRCSTDKLWKKICKTADRYYEPGKFVTFKGFEWTSWDRFGDKCVYYRGKEGNCYSANNSLSDTPDKLWDLLKAGETITIPHHTKLGGLTNWDYHNEQMQRVAEIYSLWGCSEEGSPHSVQAALSRGHKLGFVAGTDNHFGLPAHGQYYPEQGALTAVIAKELTREAIFDALLARRCYATTGKRILLYVDVNNHQMGEEFTLNGKNIKRRICVEIAGTAMVEKVELIKNNNEIHAHLGHSATEGFTYTDNSSIDGTDYYYVRVRQRDGNMAWSSPIWVTG